MLLVKVLSSRIGQSMSIADRTGRNEKNGHMEDNST